MKTSNFFLILNFCVVVLFLVGFFYILYDLQNEKQPFDNIAYFKEIKTMALEGNVTAAVWYADDLYVMSQRESCKAANIGVLSSLAVTILLGYLIFVSRWKP
jgi:hypothetical protein